MFSVVQHDRPSFTWSTCDAKPLALSGVWKEQNDSMCYLTVYECSCCERKRLSIGFKILSIKISIKKHPAITRTDDSQKFEV